MIDYTTIVAEKEGYDIVMARSKAESHFSLSSYLFLSATVPPIGGILFSSIIAFFVRTKNISSI